jgi:hypothetical protein
VIPIVRGGGAQIELPVKRNSFAHRAVEHGFQLPPHLRFRNLKTDLTAVAGPVKHARRARCEYRD